MLQGTPVTCYCLVTCRDPSQQGSADAQACAQQPGAVLGVAEAGSSGSWPMGHLLTLCSFSLRNGFQRHKTF